jgi:hypothetical protein
MQVLATVQVQAPTHQERGSRKATGINGTGR